MLMQLDHLQVTFEAALPPLAAELLRACQSWIRRCWWRMSNRTRSVLPESLFDHRDMTCQDVLQYSFCGTKQELAVNMPPVTFHAGVTRRGEVKGGPGEPANDNAFFHAIRMTHRPCAALGLSRRISPAWISATGIFTGSLLLPTSFSYSR